MSKNTKECCINSEIMNDFFLQSSNEVEATRYTCNPDLLYNGDKFNFTACTPNDVYKSVIKIKSNAVGFDAVNLKFIKLILPDVLQVLTHIFNHIICTCVYPLKWKVANIVPVAKNNSANKPEDFRPISILSAISKVFEKLLSNQIVQHLEANNLLSEHQSGFRLGRSCNSAILNVMEDIRRNFDSGQMSILILIDFSKAFDTVNYNILLDKLKNYFGFDTFSCKLIESYLSFRTQAVISNNKTSTLKQIRSGVPQGSILGPIFFSMFINDIVKCCKNSQIHMYADDVQIYFSRPPAKAEILAISMNEDLSSIYAWSQENNLAINSSKTKAMSICHTQIGPQPSLFLNGTHISFVESIKNLGFFVNGKLNCITHVNHVVSKIYGVLRKLWFSASFLSVNLKLKLVRTLIVPFLTYMANVYGELDSGSTRKLQIAINNCARYIYNKRKFDNISEFSIKILGCSCSSYFTIRNLLLLHSIIYTKEPAYLYNKLSFLKSKRTCNIRIPKHNFLSTSRQFFVSAVKHWNSLPNHLKLECRSSVFKAGISLIYNV